MTTFFVIFEKDAISPFPVNDDFNSSYLTNAKDLHVALRVVKDLDVSPHEKVDEDLVKWLRETNFFEYFPWSYLLVKNEPIDLPLRGAIAMYNIHRFHEAYKLLSGEFYCWRRA